MKKAFIFFLTLCLVFNGFASEAVYTPPLKATEVFIPIGKNGKQLTLLEFSKIKVKELEALTGNKLKLTDRVSFKITQRLLRANIHTDTTINPKKLERLTKRGEGSREFHFGGFALGLILSWVGLLVASTFEDENRSRRMRWARIGFAIGLVIVLTLLFIAPPVDLGP